MSSSGEPSNDRSQSGRPKRLSILLWLALVAAICIPVSRAILFETDHQFANLAGMGFGILAASLAYFGIWRMTAKNIWFHLLFAAFPIAAMFVFNSTVELVGFTGETLPVFRSRWAAKIVETSANAPMSEEPETSIVSAQFLGNQRDGIIVSESFGVDWQRKSPTVVWKKPIGAGWSGFSVSSGLAITLEQIEEEEAVTAFDLRNGKVVWQTKFPGKHFQALGGTGPRSTPTIFQDRVLVQTASGIVASLKLSSGEVFWKQDLNSLAGTDKLTAEQAIAWGRSGSPLVFDESVVVPFGSGPNDPNVKSLVSFELQTGNVQWTGGSTQIAYSSPMLFTICGVKQIVSVNEGNASGHNPANGDVLWTTPWPSKSNGDACASQPVAIDDRRILLGKGYALGSKLIELARVDGKDEYDATGWDVINVWNNTRILKTKFTSAILSSGALFALSDGVLECVDPMTGTRRWRGGRYGQGQMIIVNNHILVTTEDGRVVLLPATSEPTSESKGPKEIAQIPVLDGITWNVPTVAGPFLLVRNGEQVACLSSQKDVASDELNAQPAAQQ